MRHRKNFVHYLILAFVGVAVVIYITPIYWILATSLKRLSDITTRLPKFVFEVSFENYQKLMPSEGIPDVTYLFLGEVFVGLLLFGFFTLFNLKLPRALSLRNLGLIWNSIFVLTCLYSFLTLQPLQSRLQTDARLNFLLLIVCTIIAYLLIAPWRKTGGLTSQSPKHTQHLSLIHI